MKRYEILMNVTSEMFLVEYSQCKKLNENYICIHYLIKKPELLDHYTDSKHRAGSRFFKKSMAQIFIHQKAYLYIR